MSALSFLRMVWTAGRGVVVGLPEATEHSDPVLLFREWFDAAKRCGLLEPSAMTLATCPESGQPSGRTVLLKAADERGFTFYTNYGSRKARELAENERAALVFHWPVLGRQITVEGRVRTVSREEAATYFRSRPRGSQIGAWASKQSQPLTSRSALEQRYQELEREFRGKEVGLPPFWGGYLLEPTRIQFWQAGVNRLHDRIAFVRNGEAWEATRLYP